MVGTIAPLVQEAREERGKVGVARVVVAHFVSSLAGGLAVFASLRLVRVAIGSLVPGALEVVDAGAYTILAALALAAGVASILRLPLPMRDRQVPIEWRMEHGPARASVEYGFVLGAGLFTRINGAALFLAPAAAFLVPVTWVAAAPILAFAAARAGIVIARSLALAGAPPEESAAWLRWQSNVRLRFLALQLIAVTAVGAAGISTLLVGVGG
jgi:hypothetical protein